MKLSELKKMYRTWKIGWKDNTINADWKDYARSKMKISAMQARIEKLEAGLRRIINGEYDNARTIDAAEKFAREVLKP